MYIFILHIFFACLCCVSLQSFPSRSVFRSYETVIPKGWKHVAGLQIKRQNMFVSVVTSHRLIVEFRFLTRADISFSVSASHQLSPVSSYQNGTGVKYLEHVVYIKLYGLVLRRREKSAYIFSNRRTKRLPGVRARLACGDLCRLDFHCSLNEVFNEVTCRVFVLTKK